MADKALTDFVRDALAAGSDRPAIAAALKDAGWAEGQIKDALDGFAEVAFATPVPRPRTSVSAREAFLYLLVFILLAVSAGHLVSLGFILVEIVLPEPTASARGFQRAEGGIRWAVSALAVAWPLFLIVTARVARARRLNPRMQRSSVRRWLTYLALVLTAAILIGDLIAVVFNFLSGDLTAKLFLKSLIVAVVAGAIFTYYVRDAERDEGETAARDPIGLGLAAASTATIVASVVAGLVLIDSPAAARDRRIDDEAMHLAAAVAGAIDCHWTVRGRVPQTLAGLRTAYDEGLIVPGTEPLRCYIDELEAGFDLDALRYEPGADGAYRLCRTFLRASDRRDHVQRWRFDGPSWQDLPNEYPAGEHCFALQAAAIANE